MVGVCNFAQNLSDGRLFTRRKAEVWKRLHVVSQSCNMLFILLHMDNTFQKFVN